MQVCQCLQETFAHVGVYRGRGLTSPDHLGRAKIHRYSFGVGAAEINQECEGVQNSRQLSVVGGQ